MDDELVLPGIDVEPLLLNDFYKLLPRRSKLSMGLRVFDDEHSDSRPLCETTMLVNQPSRLGPLSAGLLNLSYFLTLTFPTWGALAATMYMLLQHRIFSVETFRFGKN